MNMKKYTLFLEKIVWSLAPIAWGVFIWFMDWGAGSKLIPYRRLNILFRVLLVLSIIYLVFGSRLNYAVKNYKLKFFNYTVPLPDWWKFFLLIFLVIAASFTPLWYSEAIAVTITGIIFPILEEFITRSFFVEYKMNLFGFILFNLLSSLAFTYMHAFNYQEITFIDLMQIGHFFFSFILSTIVYKTQRIELAIILHLLSNMLTVSLPNFIGYPGSSLFAKICSWIFQIVLVLCLAGCSYQEVDKEDSKS